MNIDCHYSLNQWIRDIKTQIVIYEPQLFEQFKPLCMQYTTIYKAHSATGNLLKIFQYPPLNLIGCRWIYECTVDDFKDDEVSQWW